VDIKALPLKLMIVTNAPLCSGAEEHLKDLSLWLTEGGVEVAFLVRRGGILHKTLPGDRFDIYPIDRDGPRALFSINQTFSAILSASPHVVSINREHDILPTYAALKLAAPFLKKKPKVVSVFHTPTGRKLPLLNKMDGILFTSAYTRDAFLSRNMGLADLSTVIHYGIELIDLEVERKLDPHRERIYFGGRGFPIIGMVGELWKNQVELVEVASHLVDKFPDLTVALVGGGNAPQMEAIERRASKLGLSDNILLTGRVDRGRIHEIYYDMDLSVSTHRNEGFGIVHIESLAALTPVVAYRSGGYVEMLKRGGGLLVEGGPVELAGAIDKLLSDEQKRCSLATEGRNLVEGSYTREVMGKNHLAYYEKVRG